MNEDAPATGPNARITRRSAGDSRYITPEGHAKLLQSVEAVRSALAAHPRQGDEAARQDLEAQLAVLLEALDTVEVVSGTASTDRAFFGAWVELEDDDGERVTYRLVGPDEADVKAGRVNVESPLGRALLGKEVGEEVSVQRPRGARTYTIVTLRYGG